MAEIQIPRMRSVLYVPASNAKALLKLPTLDCDLSIIDLEDAVSPDGKAEARAAMAAFLREGRMAAERIVVRINAFGSDLGQADLAAATGAGARSILLPKITRPADIIAARTALDALPAGRGVRLWLMIETSASVLNLPAIAECAMDGSLGIACLVAGTNDLAAETGIVMGTADRARMQPVLLQIVLAARAAGLGALDGVCNDIGDGTRLALECAETSSLGYDGKTLIHPSQIGPANAAFSPSAEQLAAAREIVVAFDLPANRDKAVIRSGGKMYERLHLAQAQKIIARAGPG